MTPAVVRRAGVVLVALAVGACAPPVTERCHRYDALALSRENGFAATLDWKGERAIDGFPDRVDVALTFVRPIVGPVELVHVLGDLETERWSLTLPDQNNVASTVCWIGPSGAPATCGATLQLLPYFPAGYYYLRPNGNTILEAGLAFYLCD